MRIALVVKSVTDEPQGVMYVATALKRAGHDVKLFIVDFEPNILGTIKKERPSLVGYSVTTGVHQDLLRLNRDLKRHLPFFALFGGAHATFFPEVVKEEGIDGICVGEGDGAVVDLAKALEEGHSLEGIPNLWIKDSASSNFNPPRPLVRNLETLGFPDRDCLYRYPFLRKKKVKFFMAGRGCPYSCYYCFNHSYNLLYEGKGPVVRRRPVLHLLEEIEKVRKDYPPLEFVRFVDDLFIADGAWLEEFAREYPQRVGLPFYCHLRPNLVSQKIVKLLKTAGCQSVAMAIEAGNDLIREEVLGRKMSKEQILKAAGYLHEAGIKLLTQNMLGIPRGNLETDLETLRLNIRCRPAYAWASLLHPYPRTPIYRLAKESGLETIDFDEYRPTFHLRSPFKFPEVHQIENLHKLFALTCRFPSLLPITLTLIKMKNPLIRSLYGWIYKGWKGYIFTAEMFRPGGGKGLRKIKESMDTFLSLVLLHTSLALKRWLFSGRKSS